MRQLVRKRVKKLKDIRSLKEHCQDVEQKNSPGGTSGCGITKKDKLSTRTSIHCSKNVLCYEQQSSCVSRMRRWTLRDPWSRVMIMTGPITNYICIRSLITLHCFLTFCCHWLPWMNRWYSFLFPIVLYNCSDQSHFTKIKMKHKLQLVSQTPVMRLFNNYTRSLVRAMGQ